MTELWWSAFAAGLLVGMVPGAVLGVVALEAFRVALAWWRQEGARDNPGPPGNPAP